MIAAHRPGAYRRCCRQLRSSEGAGCRRSAEGRAATLPARPTSDRGEGGAAETRQGWALQARHQLADAVDVQQHHQGRTDGLRLSSREVEREPMAVGLPSAEVTVRASGRVDCQGVKVGHGPEHAHAPVGGHRAADHPLRERPRPRSSARRPRAAPSASTRERRGRTCRRSRCARG